MVRPEGLLTDGERSRVERLRVGVSAQLLENVANLVERVGQLGVSRREGRFLQSQHAA